MKDFEGKDISIGAQIVYAVRQGSSMTLTRAEVIAWGYKAQYQGGPIDQAFVKVRPVRQNTYQSNKPVDLTNFTNLVVLA